MEIDSLQDRSTVAECLIARTANGLVVDLGPDHAAIRIMIQGITATATVHKLGKVADVQQGHDTIIAPRCRHGPPSSGTGSSPFGGGVGCECHTFGP